MKKTKKQLAKQMLLDKHKLRLKLSRLYSKVAKRDAGTPVFYPRLWGIRKMMEISSI